MKILCKALWACSRLSFALWNFLGIFLYILHLLVESVDAEGQVYTVC